MLIAATETVSQGWLNRVSLGQVLIILTGLGALWALIAKFTPVLRRIGHLVDDLSGEPARSGVPARPGLMERQALADQQVRRVADMSADVLVLIREEILPTIAQLTPNHGSHLADAIRRIEAQQKSGGGL